MIGIGQLCTPSSSFGSQQYLDPIMWVGRSLPVGQFRCKVMCPAPQQSSLMPMSESSPVRFPCGLVTQGSRCALAHSCESPAPFVWWSRRARGLKLCRSHRPSLALGVSLASLLVIRRVGHGCQETWHALGAQTPELFGKARVASWAGRCRSVSVPTQCRPRLRQL